jgi:hypothetical protein
MILDQNVLPETILAECRRILGIVAHARESNAVVHIGRFAEGMVRGLEIVNAVRAVEVVALYALFDNAVDDRLAELVCIGLPPQKPAW